MKNSFRAALQLLFLMGTLAAIGCHAGQDDPDAVTSGDGGAGPRGPKTGDLRGAESADGGGGDGGGCLADCPACAANQACIGKRLGSGPDYQATCVQTCRLSNDCPASFHCVEVPAEQAAGRVCVSAGVPGRCQDGDPVDCVAITPSRCASTDTLVLSYANGLICGYEWIFCPRGCQSDPKGSFCR